MSIRRAILAIATAATPFLASAATVNINFDELPANCCYGNAVVTGAVIYPTVTLDGGATAAVMNGTGWDQMQTSGANLYGTEGSIMNFTFAQSTSALSFDLINGTSASSFTVSAYDLHGVLLDSFKASLDSFTTPGGDQHVSFADSGIYSVNIVGDTDFAIDTVSFNTSATAVPEPTSAALLMLGVAALGAAVRRRRNAA